MTDMTRDEASVRWVDLFMDWLDTPWDTPHSRQLRAEMDDLSARYNLKVADIPRAQFVVSTLARARQN